MIDLVNKFVEKSFHFLVMSTSIFADSNTTGCRMVLRDENGSFVAGHAFTVQGAMLVEEAEALCTNV